MKKRLGGCAPPGWPGRPRSGVARSEVGMAGPPAHIQSDIFHRKWAQVSCRIIGSIVTMRPVARPPSPPRVQLSCCVQGPSCSAGLLRGCCVPHCARPRAVAPAQRRSRQRSGQTVTQRDLSSWSGREEHVKSVQVGDSMGQNSLCHGAGPGLRPVGSPRGVELPRVGPDGSWS